MKVQYFVREDERSSKNGTHYALVTEGGTVVRELELPAGGETWSELKGKELSKWLFFEDDEHVVSVASAPVEVPEELKAF